MDYLNIIASIMKQLLEKHGLLMAWASIASLIALWKLDAILTAIHLYL